MHTLDLTPEHPTVFQREDQIGELLRLKEFTTMADTNLASRWLWIPLLAWGW